MHNIIKIKNGVARAEQQRLKKAVNITITSEDQLAIVGDNGAGKSLLVSMICGESPLVSGEINCDFSPSTSKYLWESVKYITFHDVYGQASGDYYYQQRWNSADREFAPLVSELFEKCDDIELRDYIFSTFDITRMLDKQIILLSSGELRKFQIAKILLSKPRILVIDNPFVGLDVDAREQFRELLSVLISKMAIQVVLVLPKLSDIPSFITSVVEVKDGVCGEKIAADKFIENHTSSNECLLSEEKKEAIMALSPLSDVGSDNGEIVQFNNVTIKYGERTILRNLDWRVLTGEKWAVMGCNGSGKSTLLSLVFADNPQGYACDISLFGRKRGSGESIWDIKRKIGYVSAEMHRMFRTSCSVCEIVASGLYDVTGMYEAVSSADLSTAMFWLKIFGIDHLSKRRYNTLSMGEQRMTLLARAFVKNPPLLILDEPFHGLDERNTKLAKEIIENFCELDGRTVIVVTHYADQIPSTIEKFLELKRL